MARRTIKVEGLKELDRALGQLPKATAKSVLRRTLKEAAEPLARAARRLAPREDGYLIESIDVSTKLNKRQRGLHKKESGPAFAEMFVGTNNPAGVMQEFGTERHGAQPFMRPAWDQEKAPTLDRITVSLWGEIDKSAKRLARKRAKAGG